MFPSPSLSPSLSTSMSSSPPSSPTVLATSPIRPSHLDLAKVRQSSSPLRPAAYHAYGYSYTYPRGASHPLGQDHDILSADHPSKPFPPRPHAYAVIPPSGTKRSTRTTYSPLSPRDLDDNSPFYSSASESGNHFGEQRTPTHSIRCMYQSAIIPSDERPKTERTVQTYHSSRPSARVSSRDSLLLLISLIRHRSTRSASLSG
ncbi:hypothetical protein NUW54_g10872 [Trametes sanguinea]|uniref:Uncharacterized protein n=1 Tax=Trametes sanguinea TaxID=158606 RepID=A0ACC1NRB5_9APHY|nr:hypothetical protein NUW54_g10872 [Trametes sanguinea]